MADWIIWLAAFAALAAALCGDRAAIALLASLTLASAMEWAAMPFHPVLWAALDVGVCLALIRRQMPLRNVAIVLLFVPAWLAYFMPDAWRYWIPAAVVVAQFLLTLLAPDFRRRTRAVKLPPARDIFDELHLRVRA